MSHIDRSLSAVTGATYAVATLAALKALTTRPAEVGLQGSASAGDGQGGPFDWYSGDVTAADDVDVVEPTSGSAGRYKRRRERILASGIDLNGRLSAVAAITPYPSSTILEANTGIYAVQTWSGTRTDSGSIVANVLNITDTASLGDGTGAGGTHIGIGFLLAHYFGGSSVKGTRTALSVQAIQTEQTGNTGDNYSYTPFASTMSMQDTEGGTGVTAATAKGLAFGFNIITELKAAATNIYGTYGGEINMGTRTGSSVFGKSGLAIVQLDHDAVAGTVYDAAIHIANGAGGTAVGWKKGIVFGRYDGTAPMQATGTLITGEGVAGSGSWGTIDTGIDLNGFTITTNAWRSPGATINGSGNASFGSLALGGNITVTKANPSITMTNSSASSCFVRYTSSGRDTWLIGNSIVNAGAVDFYNETDAANRMSLSDTALNVTGSLVYQVAGTQVVGPRNTGWTAMTGSADESTAYDTASVTLPQLAGRVMAIQAALTTHGLIGA